MPPALRVGDAASASASAATTPAASAASAAGSPRRGAARAVGISTGGGHIDEAFDLWRILDSLGHGNGDADVSLLKVLLLSVEDMRANAGNDNIRRLHGKSHLFFIGHILQLDVGFVSKISRSFDLLEPIVPLTCQLTVW